MVGIVVVSHSPALARAAVNLALQMVQGSAPRIEIAAGTSDDRFGTDAARVVEAIIAADEGDGVVVIMDLGSAVLSAELALELLPDSDTKIRLVPAAFVEGIFAAVVSAAGGAQLDDVAQQADEALQGKATQLMQGPAAEEAGPPVIARPAIVASATVVNPNGIHARPAALIVDALSSLDADVTITTDRSAPVSARSPTALMSLGTRAGDVLRIEADGAGAAAAVDRIRALVRDGFGEMRAEPVEAGRPVPFDRLRAQEGPLGVSPGRAGRANGAHVLSSRRAGSDDPHGRDGTASRGRTARQSSDGRSWSAARSRGRGRNRRRPARRDCRYGNG
jgi:dihydroxyacetone kinase phosphotransfer subunit